MKIMEKVWHIWNLLNLELVIGFCELHRKYEMSHRAYSLQKKLQDVLDVCIIEIFKSLKFFHFKGFQKPVISFTNKTDITKYGVV